MAGVVPDWIACYCGYTIGKRLEYPKWVPASVQSFGAGCLAGFLGGVILCPFDAVKIRAQNEKLRTVEAMRILGFQGLFSGFGATMIWSVPSQGIFYLAFDCALKVDWLSLNPSRNFQELLHKLFRSPKSVGEVDADETKGKVVGRPERTTISCSITAARTVGSSGRVDEGEPPILARDESGSRDHEGRTGSLSKSGNRKGSALSGFISAFIAGGLAGIAEWIVALPLDTAKTRVQSGKVADGGGFFAACRDIFVQQGVRGFYRGFGPVLIRAFPASGAALGGIYLVENIFDRQRLLQEARPNTGALAGDFCSQSMTADGYSDATSSATSYDKPS
jgi:hypothetical protein